MATFTYCTTAQVERYLESGHGLTLAAYITEGSAQVNADLSKHYWPFPDVTDTPITPYVIQILTAMRTAYNARWATGTSNKWNEDGTTQALLDQYNEQIDRIVDEQRPSSIPTVTVAAEVMTFGTSPVGDNEYKLNPGTLSLPGFAVVPESVKVSRAGMRNFEDYGVKFSDLDRTWLFVRYDTTIVDTDTVTYEISFLRHREIPRAVSATGSVEIWRS